MAGQLNVHYNSDGESVARVSARDYLANKESYLQNVDHLVLHGAIGFDQAPGLFYNQDRLHESKVKTIDISELHSDMPVQSTAEMFKGNKHLEDIIGIESFGSMKKGVERVTDMHEMFAGCAALKSLDLGGWHPSIGDPKNMESMEGMFRGCQSLEFVNFDRHEDGSRVTDWHGAKNISEMFKDCKSLTELDVSGFVVNKRATPEEVCDFAAGCDRLKQVSLPVFMSKTDSDYRFESISRETMFHGDNALRYLSGGNETIQRDQGRFLEGVLRYEDGYSYKQASDWAKTVVDAEIRTIHTVRNEYKLQYLDELEHRDIAKSPEKSDRIYGEAGMSRGQMAESQFGHIGNVGTSMETEVEK